MTTIVYRDGVLAADTLETDLGCVRVAKAKKIGRYAYMRWALIGSACQSHRLLGWLINGANGDMPPSDDCSVIAIFDSGEAKLYSNGGWQPLGDAPYYAWGSGAAFALGAMHMGASAEEAIEVAVKFDVFSGLPMMVEK